MHLLQSYARGVWFTLGRLRATPLQKRGPTLRNPSLNAVARLENRKRSTPPTLLGGWTEKESVVDRDRVLAPPAALGLTQVGVQWLIGIGVFLFCLTASVFLISALSTLKEVEFAARRVTIVMKLLELEMPETMAAMRLSSLEISDCIEEFTGLGEDLASGLRSSANVVSAAEKGIHQGTDLIKHRLLPAIRSKAPEARNALEEMLRERAMMREATLLSDDPTERPSHHLKTLRHGVASLGMGFKALSFWKSQSSLTNPSQPK